MTMIQGLVAENNLKTPVGSCFDVMRSDHASLFLR